MLKKIGCIILMLFIIAGCTVATTGSRPMSNEEREKLLRERVMTQWEAMVKRDRERVFEMYDPFFRSRENKSAFISRQVPVYHYNPELRDMDIKGNVATVKVKVEYEIKGLNLHGKEINQPRKETVVTETWIFIDDNWYKQHIDYIMDATFAPY